MEPSQRGTLHPEHNAVNRLALVGTRKSTNLLEVKGLRLVCRLVELIGPERFDGGIDDAPDAVGTLFLQSPLLAD